jgi:hypothetical protein
MHDYLTMAKARCGPKRIRSNYTKPNMDKLKSGQALLQLIIAFYFDTFYGTLFADTFG